MFVTERIKKNSCAKKGKKPNYMLMCISGYVSWVFNKQNGESIGKESWEFPRIMQTVQLKTFGKLVTRKEHQNSPTLFLTTYNQRQYPDNVYMIKWW